MIASVRGPLLARRPDHVVVECGGVGYKLAVSANTLRTVPAVGEEVALYAHLVTRDDGMYLFGYATEEERELFLMLTQVLINAIASGDAARFQAVPGIGKRTAERIIVELREKVAGRATVDDIVITRSDDPRTMAREGLVGLGYTQQEADQLLDKTEGDTPEDLIAGALRATR
jgi:Holliday junction DNA helicase RuvA